MIGAMLALMLLSAAAQAPAMPPSRGYVLADERVTFAAPPARGELSGANYSVSFRLLNHGSTIDTPVPQAWDGVHVALRYGGECRAYYASVNRRDGKIVIKKRVPDGRSDCGTYYNLSRYAAYDPPYGEWQNIRVTVRTRRDLSVDIRLYIGGRLLAEGIDDGRFGPPILDPGVVMLRCDATDAEYDNLLVEPARGFDPKRPLAAVAPQLLPTDQPPEPLPRFYWTQPDSGPIY